MLVLQYLKEIHINPFYFLSLRYLGVLLFKGVEYLQKHGNTNCPKSQRLCVVNFTASFEGSRTSRKYCILL